jgi:hypothetical protein
MTYSPPMPLALPMIHTWTTTYLVGDWSSGQWEAADRCVYLPILVQSTCVARRLWWANGATVSASYNIDCGIYRDAGHKPGTLLVSAGSTAQGTASTVQFADVTDTLLAPGRYWLGMGSSSASATFFRTVMVGSTAIDAAVRLQEASAVPLPATATPVESTSANLYLFGFATTASP